MEISRLGVSISPTPTLSVEFTRDSKLLVWRVEFTNNDNKSVDEIVLGLKTRFPKYLSKVSVSQLHRLVKFGLKLSSKNDDTQNFKPVGNNSKFVYDYRMDFKTENTNNLVKNTSYDSDESD